MLGWSYVLLSKHEEKDRARISYLVEYPSLGLFKYRLQLRPRAQAAFAAHYLRLEKASCAFQRTERLSLIKPMCLDIANQASLTTYAEGLPFSEFMRDAAEITPSIFRCCNWLENGWMLIIEPKSLRPAFFSQNMR